LFHPGSHPSVLIGVILGGLCSVCAAQSAPQQEIVTDRPDITESSTVVPPGTLVAENGLTWTRNRSNSVVDLSESLVRLGLGSRTELRLGVPIYVRGMDGRGTISGLQDASLGVKQQIGPLPGNVDLSVIVALCIPAGALSTHGVDPLIKLPWSRELVRGWSVGGMQSFFYRTEDSLRKPVWEPAFYVERQLTRRSDAFVEYGGDFPRGGASRQVIHAGTAWRVTPKQQVDFHFGFGLSAEAPKYFVAGGYSIRVDNVFHALWK
jgi:outer membrane putative beta-barrel porin/alpha-amylase